MSAHLFCRPICQPPTLPYLLLLGLSCSCKDVAFSTKKVLRIRYFSLLSHFPYFTVGRRQPIYCFSPPSSSAAAVIIMFYRRLDRYGKVNATRNGKKPTTATATCSSGFPGSIRHWTTHLVFLPVWWIDGFVFVT